MKLKLKEGKWNYPPDLTANPVEISDMGNTNQSDLRKRRKEWRKKQKAKKHKLLKTGKLENDEKSVEESLLIRLKEAIRLTHKRPIKKRDEVKAYRIGDSKDGVRVTKDKYGGWTADSRYGYDEVQHRDASANIKDIMNTVRDQLDAAGVRPGVKMGKGKKK